MTPPLWIAKLIENNGQGLGNTKEKSTYPFINLRRINELEKLDDTIDMKIFENDRLKDEISKASAVLAVQRNKLTAATASCLDFQTKYEDIINKHQICFPN